MYITNLHPAPRPPSLPAYFLGRPADMYRRRYRSTAVVIRPGT